MSENQKTIASVSVLALIFFAIAIVAVRYPEHRFVINRLCVVFIFTILPAVMYFVFIALRKSSLLQEYVSNLYRLGVLDTIKSKGMETSELDRRSKDYFHEVRLLSYLKRFESVYGPIHDNLTTELLNVIRDSNDRNPDIATSLIRKNAASGMIFSFSTAIPVFIATMLIGIGWMLCLPPMEGDTSILDVNEDAALFGFLGAYFFSLQMLFRRFVRNDLRAKAYVAVSMRIIMAVIGAWILQQLFQLEPIAVNDGVQGNSQSLLLVLAFVIGAFPPVLWRMIRAALSVIPGAVFPIYKLKFPLGDLDGLTVWHQARLEEEDVENGFNMANVDILDLMLNTKIPPDRIIDWVDQAILLSSISQNIVDSGGIYNHLKSVLGIRGIRSASVLTKFKPPESLPDTGSAEMNPSASERGVLDAAKTAVNGYANLRLVRNWKLAPTNGSLI